MPQLSPLPLYLANSEEEIRLKLNDPDSVRVALDLKKSGFSLLENFLSSETVDQIVNESKAHFKAQKANTVAKHRWQDGWKKSPVIKSLAVDDKINDILSSVYGKPSFAFQTLNFDRATEQKLHSDCIHFNSYPNHFMAGVWVALEDVDEQNGALRYVKNSHMLPYMDLYSLNLQNGTPLQNNSHMSYPEYERFLEDMVVNFGMEVKLASMKKGDAFIWSSGLIHGGAKLKNPKSTRFSQVTHYFFKDCLYYTPLSSNSFSGRLQLRTPMDVATEQEVSFKTLLQNAKKLGVPRSQVLRSWYYTYRGK